jgi:hypothetical protein
VTLIALHAGDKAVSGRQQITARRLIRTGAGHVGHNQTRLHGANIIFMTVSLGHRGR